MVCPKILWTAPGDLLESGAVGSPGDPKGSPWMSPQKLQEVFGKPTGNHHEKGVRQNFANFIVALLGILSPGGLQEITWGSPWDKVSGKSPGKVLLIAGEHSRWRLNHLREISRNLPDGLLETKLKPLYVGYDQTDATAWTAFTFTEEFLVADPMVPGVCIMDLWLFSWNSIVWFEEPGMTSYAFFITLINNGAILDKVKSTWNLYHWISCLIGITCS